MFHSRIVDWFGKHKKTKTMLIIFAAMASLQTVLTINGLMAQAETVDTPKYEIVQTKENVGVAKNTEYHVLIAPIDLSSDSFKGQIKSIFTDLSKKEGKPEFGATIYTDKEVLEYDTGIKGMPENKDYFSGSTGDRFKESIVALDNDVPDAYLNSQQLAYRKAVNAFKAKQKEVFGKEDTHLVASYTGGFNYDTGEASKDDGAYNILWFGSTDTKHSQVGKYAGNEKWKPNVESSKDSDSEGCFIATAAYGTETAEDIDSLRGFRDNHLKTNATGKAFVDFYYDKAPAAADYIANKPVLRAYVRENYVKPAVTVVEFFGLNK